MRQTLVPDSLNLKSQISNLLLSTAYCLLLTTLCLLPTSSASAHTRVEIGPYVVVVGWLNEPPIVGERNALTIEMSEEQQPLSGAEATLDIELSYGGRTTSISLVPTTTPGLYTAEIFPTVRGQYTVRLFGTLGETAVDEMIDPEEILPASQLQFPDPLPDTLALQQQVESLQGQVQSARTLALVGAIVGLLALILAAVGFLRKR